ncbi:universal stress protein [Desulfoferrobacter suflitae]|uniref:universal stress protein n=1 Tax=Desulfoferrobacter suflitae TaxID=2865782 RepID=UPI0021642321|nr:universal stress protein [Desulfoferrobacter suflitae]MCK8603719.1 universal stress protein [Desulfoferrobacter suflitae]
MFKKILFATDLSPASEALIQCAGELKTIGMEEVVLAHIIYVANRPGVGEMLAQDAQPDLDRQKEILQQQGLKVTCELIVGPVGLPAVILNDLAGKYGVSAVLIGSHGKGIFARAALGSVSSRLLEITAYPVLLARIGIGEEEKCFLQCERLLANLLFPTDFSDTAERAFFYLGSIVTAAKCPVTLLHVRNRDAVQPHLLHRLEDLKQLDLSRLGRMKTRLELLGSSRVAVEVGYGVPSREIIERVGGGDFSMIVMGGRGKGYIKEVCLGSVANEVAQHSKVSVLFISAIR